MANIRLNDLYDIEDLALETGATVEYASGRKFNTSGREAARKPKPVAVPTPVESAPVKPDVSAELLRQMIAVLNRPVDVRLPEMPAPQVTVTPAAQVASKPVSWTFEFERNPNGTIKRINATPKE